MVRLRLYDRIYLLCSVLSSQTALKSLPESDLHYVLNTAYTSVWWSISLRQRYSFTVLLFTSVYMERLMNITNVDIWDMELSTSSFMLMLFNLFSDRRLCLKTLIILYFHCVSLCFFFSRYVLSLCITAISVHTCIHIGANYLIKTWNSHAQTYFFFIFL